MHQDQIPLRSLHDLLLEYEGPACYVAVLLPWLAANQEIGEPEVTSPLRTKGPLSCLSGTF